MKHYVYCLLKFKNLGRCIVLRIAQPTMLEQLTKRQRALLEQASSSSSNSNGNNEPQRDPECENEASNVGEKVIESVEPSKDLHIERLDESAVAETMDYENNSGSSYFADECIVQKRGLCHNDSDSGSGNENPGMSHLPLPLSEINTVMRSTTRQLHSWHSGHGQNWDV